MIDGFVQVCSSSLDLNNSFIEDSVRLLESFFSILMSDFRWGNEAIWLASCKVTKVDTDKTRWMFDITCYPWTFGRTNLDGKGFGDPQVQTSEGKNAVETVVTTRRFTLQHFNLSLIYPTTLGHSPQSCSSPLKTMGWKPKYILGLSIFIFVYDEILARISFNFHMIRLDVYSICRFNMIEHDLTAHSKTPVQHKGLPFPGHVAPMDACVLGQCRSAAGGDLDWAIDQ